MRTSVHRELVRHTRSRNLRRRAFLLVAGSSCLALPAAGAQVVPGSGAGIGTLAADRARVRQVTGKPDSLGVSDSLPGLRPLLPTIRSTWNSELPSQGNDGSLWAGRGESFSITGGARYVRNMDRFRLEAV